MFGRKTNNASSKSSTNNTRKSLSQYGLLDIGDIPNMNDMEDIEDDDEDLEAELLALTKGSTTKSKVNAKPVIDPTKLNQMIQDSLRDVPSDEEMSSDEDDPNIMAELQELQSDNEESENLPQSVTSKLPSQSTSLKHMLEERLNLYQTAEQNAKDAGDSMKTKRMARGIAVLKDLIRKSGNGQQINEDDIPPIVSVGSSKPVIKPEEVSDKSPKNEQPTQQIISSSPPPIPPRTSLPSLSINQSNTHQTEDKSEKNALDLLREREMQYKKGAVLAKKTGDIKTALTYMKIVKSLEPLIKEVEQGAIVNLDSLPPPLPDSSSNIALESVTIQPSITRQESEKQKSIQINPVVDESEKNLETPQSISTAANTPPQPTTVLEALEQRLKVFKDREEAAKKENDNSKARRNGRIVKQYEDAIKLHKSGKPFPVDELPTPPGWPPIPVNGSKPNDAINESSNPQSASNNKAKEEVKVQPSSTVSVKGHSAGYVSRNEKQLQQVLERQKAFKAAALKAKKEGDIEKAKEYLRVVMGIEPMIEASKSGIPIDLNSLPLLPSEKAILEEPKGEVIQISNCIQGTDLDVYHKLESDLQHQIELCGTTRDHFKAIGDITNANRFDQLALQCKKDLKFVQLANSGNLRVPKFHYETKSFSIVQCNTELTDNDVEVCVVQGVNYNVPNPKEIDTYVKLQFPYPTDAPQVYKSGVVYNTNNPSYNTSTIFSMERNARACQRIFKRQTLKCEVWSKGGFFRGDSLIGTANVKLTPLETHCTVHDAYDLMDGRRSVGGKVEIKIRIRDPILRKQVEHVEEKWLIIDS